MVQGYIQYLLNKADQGHFKYYQKGLKTTYSVQILLVDENDRELVRADVLIEAPKQDLTIVINGEERTGAYEVKQINQKKYVALSVKEPNIIYAVQPDDSESDKVYFLGETAIDVVKTSSGTNGEIGNLTIAPEDIINFEVL